MTHKIKIMAAMIAASAGLIGGVCADPVDEKLLIDGVEMITKAKAPEGYPFPEVLSGWLFREAETRALEMDSFQNPAMLAVELGAEIWKRSEGAAGKSCESCHGNAADSMKAVGASYPKWNEKAGKPQNVELRVEDCRVNQMKAEPFKFDSAEQKALTAYIKYQGLGAPVGIDLKAGDMQSWWEKGKTTYYTRFGQLNMSCATCHEANVGHMIRADHLSQGQINGFPAYRLKDGLNSVHGRFRGCIRDTRAEMPKGLSDELLALEVYVTWRGTGLSVESPSVRH